MNELKGKKKNGSNIKATFQKNIYRSVETATGIVMG